MTRPTPAPRPNPRLDDYPMQASKNAVTVDQLRERQDEKTFLAQVMTLLRHRNWMAYHTYRSTKSAAGFPDILAVRGGRIVALELKTERGMVSPAQRAWLDALAQCPGVTALVARPSEWALLDAVTA